MTFKERSYEKELLDQEHIPFEDIKRNMAELDVINTWLGGHQISINGFRKILGTRKTVTICEIGCGGGDNLVALNRWCKDNNIAASFIGIDLKSECIEVAKSRNELTGKASWISSDYRAVSFSSRPDIIFSSLFCHHFSNIELTAQLTWMNANSSLGFFINDLHRNKLAYTLIKLLTTLFSKSYLVKHDAPLSVARAFKKHDWISLLSSASIHDFKVQWKWAFRYLVTVKHAC